VPEPAKKSTTRASCLFPMIGSSASRTAYIDFGQSNDLLFSSFLSTTEPCQPASWRARFQTVLARVRSVFLSRTADPDTSSYPRTEISSDSIFERTPVGT